MSVQNYLDKAASAYYEGNPFLSDAEFDYLARIYNYNQLGAKPLKSGTLPHINRLYSLQKFYTGDKLPELDNPVESPKLDGSCISITYINNMLDSVVTRGDGIIGQDVTKNFIGWNGIPQAITFGSNNVIQVVGELIAPLTIDNARNYAAGAANLKDKEEFLKRDLTFIAYAVFIGSELLQSTYREAMSTLSNWGFSTVLDKGLVDIYPTDGIVYRENDNTIYNLAGFTDKYPKGAFALKTTEDFETVITTLLDVVWETGKSGKVTPVAVLEPIVVEDALVSRATLNNVGFIDSMGMKIGDELLLTRSGGIIPKILGVANET